jgi:pimeloyl-ACP methyl ester carboxylesterase
MKVTIDGAAVYAQKTGGNSPTLIFLHGAGMDLRVWEPVAAQLAESGYATTLLDWPGHGQSEGAPLTSIPKLSRWIAAFIEAQTIKQPVLIGHSMGAAAALNAAATMRNKITGAIFCGIAKRLSVHPDLLRLATEDRKKAESLIADWGVASASPNLSMQPYFAPQKDHVLATDLKACNDYDDAIDAARTLTCPTLFLLGEKDKMTPPEKAVPLIAAALNAYSEEVPACGHMMQLEAPEKVAAAIARFLQQIP